MRTEIKDVDTRDACSFVQDLLDDLKLNAAQVDLLERVLRSHEMPVNIWVDSSGDFNAGPKY